MNAHVEDVTDANFKSYIEEHPLVLADFWAGWCPPCRTQLPVLDAFANKHQGQIKVVKLEFDKNQRTAAELDINALPTMVIYKDGKPQKTLIGLHALEALETALAPNFVNTPN